jgi:hypothetical protein
MLSDCIPLENKQNEVSLRDYGTAGSFVAEQVSSHLKLQHCQQSMLTTLVSFSVLGGDSLTAILIARALHAHHHGVGNSRHLGGKYMGLFYAPYHSQDLGAYVDSLDENGVCSALQQGGKLTHGKVDICRCWIS